MNEVKRERARDMFEEGLGAAEISRRLELSEHHVKTMRKEFSFCLTCGTKLRVPTGSCLFCVHEAQMKEPA